MNLSKLPPSDARKILGVVMAIGSLLFITPLYLIGAPHARAGMGPRLLLLFLIVPVVYLVFRYVRASVIVKVLSIGLLVAAAEMIWHPVLNDLQWLETAAAGLCGLGLLLGIRWAPYLWYATAFALLAGYAYLIQQAQVELWHFPMVPIVLWLGLLLLILGGGGSVAVAMHSKAMKSAPIALPASRRAGDRIEKWFAFLCAVCIVGVTAQWLDSRIPDTAGISQLHPSLRPLAEGGSRSPMCNKVAYCGAYVELSCHPESDGPVSYYNNKSGALVMSCGGECWGGQGPAGTTRCSACPPPEWTSCTSSKASTEK